MIFNVGDIIWTREDLDSEAFDCPHLIVGEDESFLTILYLINGHVAVLGKSTLLDLIENKLVKHEA